MTKAPATSLPELSPHFYKTPALIMGKTAVKGLFHLILIATTFALAVVTIIASRSGHCHPENSTIMPLLGLAVPVLLVSCLIVALCWALARRKWAFVTLTAFFFNWEYLTAVIRFGSPHEVPATAPAPNRQGENSGYLTVATYNVHNFGNEITGYSCKQIAKYMQQQHVDVLCFQEFGENKHFTADSLRRALSHWQYAIIPADDSIRGILPIAVFSRYPLIGGRFITYPHSANCSMLCDIILNTDTIRLLNNHLQTTSVSQNRKKWERELSTDNTRREAQAVQDAAETLHENFVKRAFQTDSICQLATASPHPVLVCGDFNSLPSSYTYHRLSESLKDGFKTGGHGYMYTYRYGKRMLRIDYAFHSPELECTDYYSPNLDLCSDHNPVIFTVKY